MRIVNNTLWKVCGLAFAAGALCLPALSQTKCNTPPVNLTVASGPNGSIYALSSAGEGDMKKRELI